MNLTIYDYSGKKRAILKNDSSKYISGETVNEQLTTSEDGQNDLTFVLPMKTMIDGVEEDNYRESEIVAEYMVKLVKDDGSEHIFKIKSDNDIHSSDGMLTSNVQCKSISNELGKKNTEVIADVTGTASVVLEYCLNKTGWSLDHVDSFDGKELSLKQSSKSNALNMINECQKLFDGYVVYDTVNKKVNFYSNDNINDTQILFTIGKNITSLERLTTSSDIVTRLFVSAGEISSGEVSIQTVNPTGENYIDNFQYYIDNGMIDEDCQAKIVQYNIDIKNINDLLTSVKSEINTIDNDIMTNNVPYNTAVKLRESKQNRIVEIDAKLELESDTTTISQLNSEKSTLQSDISNLNTTISNYESTLDGLNSNLESKNATLETHLSTKDSIVEAFYDEFNDFIHEGYYQNTNLIEPQSIYDDGLKKLNELAFPKVSYKMGVVDLARATGIPFESFKLHDIIHIRDNFMKLKTKARITKIEEDLSNPTKTTIEIANYYSNVEELMNQITRNVEIVKNQQKYWDRSKDVVNPDGTLNTAKMQATFQQAMYQLVHGTNGSTVSGENGIESTSVSNSSKQIRMNDGKIEGSNDGGLTWEPIITSDGANMANVFGSVLKVSEIYLKGSANFFWNGDGLFAINSSNINQWIRFNDEGLVATMDNGETFEFSLTWAGLQIGKHSVDGLQDELDAIDSKANNALTKAQEAFEIASTSQGTADEKIDTFFQSTQPSGSLGDLWVNSGNGNRLYRYNGSTWESVQDTGISEALTSASNAQSVADGKITSFYQTSAPTNSMSEGDLWIDTDDGYKLYRYNGASWINIQDSKIATAIATASTAQSVANSALSASQNALQANTFYNRTKISTSEGIQVFDGENNERVQIGAIDSDGDDIKDTYGLRADHSDGSYSVMSPHGFSKKVAIPKYNVTTNPSNTENFVGETVASLESQGWYFSDAPSIASNVLLFNSRNRMMVYKEITTDNTTFEIRYKTNSTYDGNGKFYADSQELGVIENTNGGYVVRTFTIQDKGIHCFVIGGTATLEPIEDDDIYIDYITFEKSPKTYTPNGQYEHLNKTYNYTTYHGTGSTSSGIVFSEELVPDVWVQLPDEFKGNDFDVTVFLQDTGEKVGSQIDKINVSVVEKDILNGRFKVEALINRREEVYYLTFGYSYPEGSYVDGMDSRVYQYYSGCDFAYIATY